MKTLADLAVEKQPKPVINKESLDVSIILDHHHFSPEVRAAIDARTAMGVETYGQTLHSHDGRHNNADLVQELVDATKYAAKGVIETGSPIYKEIMYHMGICLEKVKLLSMEREL